MGAAGAGKSFVRRFGLKLDTLSLIDFLRLQFINAVLNNSDMIVGNGLKACTKDIRFGDATMVKEIPHLGEHRLVLVDTPGFEDSIEDLQTLKTIADCLRDLWVKSCFHTDLA